MPYIDKDKRQILDPEIYALEHKLYLAGGFDAGHINYAFSRILHLAWKAKPKYLTAAILIGTVVCVIFEFYRRVISPYEDEKIKENGDI